MTTYTVALSKGGSTKTTTAAELVVALTRRALAIDLDQRPEVIMALRDYLPSLDGDFDDIEQAGPLAYDLNQTSTPKDADHD